MCERKVCFAELIHLHQQFALGALSLQGQVAPLGHPVETWSQLKDWLQGIAFFGKFGGRLWLSYTSRTVDQCQRQISAFHEPLHSNLELAERTSTGPKPSGNMWMLKHRLVLLQKPSSA